ncbi:AzlD domain-containing protein [Enterococcus nangangensis]|uniref:AzlD domain-containing protein n=1 Tax=Enterococcus nangangensis TaxID=2559926 RepID=UPI0010F9E2B8|nr:AzlD domain-containing protein [Enterococcus nangangensis]
MPSFNFIILTIVGCSLATWLSRALPFVLLKKFDLPKGVVEYLGFVPIVIMSALWFNSLFTQQLGHFPQVNWENLLASVPTIISAVVTKSLLFIVAVGIISLAVLRLWL